MSQTVTSPQVRAYPYCPSRPQAYRQRSRRARASARHGIRTSHFGLAALVLLACATVATTSRSASAAPAFAELDARTAIALQTSGVTASKPAVAPDSPPARPVLPDLDSPRIVEPMTAAPSAQAPAARLKNPAAIASQRVASGQGRQLRAQVTAYSASEEEGTAWGITRSGTLARPGVVAVDPRVIPLGSRVRITGLPGVYRAEDTGGGIIGAHVDVFMESRDDALRFGRQTSVLIEVLD